MDLDKEADAIEAAVKQVLKDGYRTGDIMSEGMHDLVGNRSKMGDLIAERVYPVRDRRSTEYYEK